MTSGGKAAKEQSSGEVHNFKILQREFLLFLS